MASNRLRRTRTVSKYLTSVDSRLKLLNKRPAPRRITNNVIQSRSFRRQAVTTSSLGARSVTEPTMGFNSVSSFAIQDGAVTYDTLSTEVQTELSTTESLANIALTSANGKNAIYRQSTAPPTANEGDIWFDVGNDNRMHRRSSGAWVGFSLGDKAIASLSANKITAGSIDAQNVVIENLDAGNITVGTLSGIGIALGDGTNVNFRATNTGLMRAINAEVTGFIRATTGFIGAWEVEQSGRLVSTSSAAPMIFSPTENGGTGAIAASGIRIGNGDITCNNISMYDPGAIYYFGQDGSSHGIGFAYDEGSQRLFAQIDGNLWYHIAKGTAIAPGSNVTEPIDGPPDVPEDPNDDLGGDNPLDGTAPCPSGLARGSTYNNGTCCGIGNCFQIWQVNNDCTVEFAYQEGPNCTGCVNCQIVDPNEPPLLICGVPPTGGTGTWAPSGAPVSRAPTYGGATCNQCELSVWQNYAKTGCADFDLLTGCVYVGCDQGGNPITEGACGPPPGNNTAGVFADGQCCSGGGACFKYMIRAADCSVTFSHCDGPNCSLCTDPPPVSCGSPSDSTGWTASGGQYELGPTAGGAACASTAMSIWQNYTKSGCPNYAVFIGCTNAGNLCGLNPPDNGWFPSGYLDSAPTANGANCNPTTERATFIVYTKSGCPDYLVFVTCYLVATDCGSPPGNGWTTSGGEYQQAYNAGGATCAADQVSIWQNYDKPVCATFALFLRCEGGGGGGGGDGGGGGGGGIVCGNPPGDGWTPTGGAYTLAGTAGGAPCTADQVSNWQNYDKAGCPTYALFTSCSGGGGGGGGDGGGGGGGGTPPPPPPACIPCQTCELGSYAEECPRGFFRTVYYYYCLPADCSCGCGCPTPPAPTACA